MNSKPESESPYKFVPLGMSFEDYHQNRAVKARKIIEILQSILGDLDELSLLDIGCHDGGLTCHFSGFFNTVIGVDNDTVSVAIANETFQAENLTFIAMEQGGLPFGNGEFDVILTNHVIYYVEDKQLFVNEIMRVLKPSGLCYLSATNGLYTDLIMRMPEFIKNSVTSFLLGSSRNFGSPIRYEQYCAYFEGVSVVDMTYDIIKYPQKYAGDITGFKRLVLGVLSRLPDFFLGGLSKLSPTFIFLLSK